MSWTDTVYIKVFFIGLKWIEARETCLHWKTLNICVLNFSPSGFAKGLTCSITSEPYLQRRGIGEGEISPQNGRNLITPLGTLPFRHLNL